MTGYAVSFVALPIGNREDITRRALDVLQQAAIICCEDTRRTAPLLSYYGICRKKLISLHNHNERSRAVQIAMRAAGGEKFAVVSDAGMPGVSDPGYRLVRELEARGVAFTVIPGPSAVLTALVGSALPSDSFYFGGFISVKKNRRAATLSAALAAPYTSIYYESPYRISSTLHELAQLSPTAPVCVARELTKLHEQFHRGNADQLAQFFRTFPQKGEMVLLIGGTNAQPFQGSKAAIPPGAG